MLVRKEKVFNVLDYLTMDHVYSFTQAESQGKARQEKDRAERRQEKEEAKAQREEEQPALFEF